MQTHQETPINSLPIPSKNHRKPLIVAGLLIGMGQAGFFDGIVLHQLLQWHHLFSSVKTDATIAGLELNTIGDGLFHAFDWLLTSVGILCLWSALKQENVSPSTPTFIGSILMGAGLFNLIEGLIDHHILGIHHVKPGPHEFAWDLGFLAVGAILAILGAILLKSDAKINSPDPQT